MTYTPFKTTTSSNKPAILPEDRHQLITLPVEAASIAFQVGTTVDISGVNTRVPRLNTDPTAAWIAEAAEITPSNPAIDDIVITPPKVAGLTVVSNELAADSSPAAAELIGKGLARDIAKQVDTAFFGNTTANGPNGVKSLTTTVIDNIGTWTNLDAFAEAISTVESFGVKPTAFVANPADALDLMQLKEATGSIRPLLGPDPSQPTRRTIFGVPLLQSTDVDSGVVWCIPAERVIIARRTNVDLDVDTSAYFTSYSTAIRAVMRIGWGFPQPMALVKMALADLS